MNRKTKILLSNTAFVAVCIGIFLFLWNAPPETTAPLPHDEDHSRFVSMKKKEAEQFCNDCHGETGEVPLPENHPPKYRCLFCHKRI